MKVNILNFRGVEKATYNFEPSSLTLINGPSGQGKSTIFSAITWCLFGQLRNIDPHGTKAKVCVSIKNFHNLDITRKKNPGLLKVIKEGQEYEDDVAQALIDSLTTASLWPVVSYIPQGQRNALLTASNTEKMEFLRYLCFGPEDPQKQIDKVKEYLQTIDKSLDSKKELLQSLSRDKGELKDANMEEKIDLDNIKKKRSDVRNMLKEIRQKHITNEKNKSLFLSLNKEKEEIEKSIKDKIVVDNTLYEQLNNCKLGKEIKEKINKCDNLLYSLLPPQGEYKHLDLKNIRRQEEEYEKGLNICQSLDIDLDEESVKETLDNLIKLMHIQPQLKALKKAKEIEEEMKLYKSDRSEENIQIQLKELQGKLTYAELTSHLFICPNCKISLKLRAKKLEIVSDKPTSLEEIEKLKEEIQELTQELNKTTKYKELDIRYKEIMTSVDKKEVYEQTTTLMNDKQVKICQDKIRGLQSITVFAPPQYKSKDIEQWIKYDQLLKEKEELVIRYRPYQHLDYSLLAREKDIKKEREEILKKKGQQEEKEKRLKIILKTLNNIVIEEDMESKIKQLEQEEEQYEKDEKRGEEVLRGQKIIARWQECKSEVEALETKSTLALKLKNKVIAAQNYMLESTVYTINQTVKDVVNLLFNQPITVTLELFKRVKSTNQLKAQINFVIFYKGCEYNSIDCLSGGEADRVSLAFTIALNRISSSPLILLDECMSSLDQDIREQCLDCLKTLTGKTILLINHDGVEGHYDNVIKL